MHLTGLLNGQNQRTPLLEAARTDRVEMAQLLLEKGANIEATEKVQFVAFIH